MVKDGQGRTTKRRIQEWWNEFQKKGEKQVLIEATAKGDDNSPYQAQRLVEKYPNAALEAIIQGARASERSWTRTTLVNLAGEIKGDAATEFLDEEMRRAPSLDTRVASASGLIARGQSSKAVATMIREWEKLYEDDPQRGKPPFEIDGGDQQLIAFLAGCGKAEAINALARGFESHSVGRRLSIVSAFSDRAGSFSMFASGHGGGLNIPDEAPKFSPEVKKAIEKLLVGALGDTEEREGMSGSWNGKSFSDPRICDVAGHVLSLRWKDKYRFDLSAGLRERDVQRFEAINVWRREQGLELIKPPQRMAIPVVPDSKTSPLLTRVDEAKGEEARNRAIAELEQLGIGALPAVRRAIETLQDPAAKRDLSSAASRLANVVTEVEYLSRSATPDEAFRRRIETLKEKPLTSKGLVDLIVSVTRKLPKGAAGIKIAADRYSDNTGVVLTVTLAKEQVPQAGTQKGWSTSMRVQVEKEDLLGSFGSSSYSHRQKVEAYQNLAGAMDKALASPPDQSFHVRASVVLENQADPFGQ